MFRYGWKLVVLIIIAAVVFLWLIKAPIMSNYLTKKIGVPVTVRTISMWPTKTKISHFRISNPPQYRTRTAFEVDKTVIEYDWKDLRDNPHDIDLITLNDVFLNIYINSANGKDNNWADIGAGMPERRSSGEVIVHKLVMNNITVMTEGPGAKKLGIAGTQHFDTMSFNEIDSREGFPTKELISNIFQGIGMKQFLDKFLNPERYIQKAMNPWKIFGEAPRVEGPPSED